MNGYGPSLADEGYGPGDLEDLYVEQAHQWWRNKYLTGWALPDGRENDFRVRQHLFKGPGLSACGKWSAPANANFESGPTNGYACTVCEGHERARPERYQPPPDFP